MCAAAKQSYNIDEEINSSLVGATAVVFVLLSLKHPKAAVSMLLLEEALTPVFMCNDYL